MTKTQTNRKSRQIKRDREKKNRDTEITVLCEPIVNVVRMRWS